MRSLRRIRRYGHAFAAAGGIVACVPRVHAQAAAPTSRNTEYSAYEREAIARAFAATDLVLEREPEGKVVERIETVRLDVFESQDPLPERVVGLPLRSAANALHTTSQDFVIRRESLLAVGDVYSQALADEMARNMRLRMPLQVSIVIVVPFQGSEPGKVGVLLITKDIWSLRVSFDVAATPGGVESLLLVPQETNLFGAHHTLQTRFLYQPESYTFGAGYRIPRFGASWVGASAAGSVTMNRQSGDLEGSSASVAVGRNLYSTRTEWAWGAEGSYSVGVARRYVNASVARFDSKLTPENDRIPNEYESRTASASVAVTRSFGWRIKNNVSLSLNVTGAEYKTPRLESYDARAVGQFVEQFVPRGEMRVYPTLSWATFANDFLRTLEISTLSLQEDYRLGHSASVSVYPVRQEVGSTRDLVGSTASAGYTAALGDGLASASVSSVVEVSRSEVTDASLGGGLTVVTPRLGFGRVVFGASMIRRFRNYLRARTITGGDDRLRGYPSNYFIGSDAAFSNLEFRSASLAFKSVALAGVAFVDVGDASNDFDWSKLKASTGVGFRVLFPQINRFVFRGDLAFPLVRGPFSNAGATGRVDPVGFFFSFGQAFGP